jgi:tRNA A58 N-methylase Trm61
MKQRRDFIKQMSLASAALIATPSFAKSIIFNTDIIRVATIGVNGMGWSNTTAALKVKNVEVVALCDIDGSVLSKRKQELLLLQPNVKNVDTYNDYQKILDRKDIDVVIVGTPDHWHALQMINACSAGKHCQLINDDAFLRNLKLTLQKVEKATETLEDAGPLQVIGTAAGSIF